MIRKHPEYILGLNLLHFEALCHYELTKCLINMFKTGKGKPKYGCESGLNAFVATGYQLDASVFLYECVKHFSIRSPDEALVFTQQPLFSDLEVVRNNIHTYFKKGGFAEKTKSIRDAKVKDYKLDNIDFTCFLRNDISLVFHIKDFSRQLIGCDYFISHCIFESNNKNWEGKDYRNYASFLSGSIKGVVATIDETPYRLPMLKLCEHMPDIELFDYKSADLETCSVLSSTTTFRLLLMLYQNSYILILTEEILDLSTILKDDLWSCFFGKLMSVKYDESFDNLQSLVNYSKDNDKSLLKEYLTDDNLKIDNLQAKKFAQKLRNTIHYQKLQFNNNILYSNSTREITKVIYLSNTNTSNIGEFKNNIAFMINEMKQLQKLIRKIISLDKDYGF